MTFNKKTPLKLISDGIYSSDYMFNVLKIH